MKEEARKERVKCKVMEFSRLRMESVMRALVCGREGEGGTLDPIRLHTRLIKG